MGKKLVALLRCRIQANGVVNAVLDSERHFLVATVDRTGTGIDQMLDGVMPTGLEDVVETYDVALDIGIGVLDAVAYTGLGRQVHDDVEMMLGKKSIDERFVSKVASNKAECRRFYVQGQLFDFFQAVFLEADVIIGIQVVEAYYTALLALKSVFQKTLYKVGADKSGCAGDEDVHISRV